MVAEEVTPFRALAASSAATEAEAESVDEPEKALVDLLDVSRNPSEGKEKVRSVNDAEDSKKNSPIHLLSSEPARGQGRV